VAGTSERAISGDPLTGGATSNLKGSAMGEWLIADVSLWDVHIQLWMLLVTGVVSLWLLYVWATRSVH
jgi:hypothetical protein